AAAGKTAGLFPLAAQLEDALGRLKTVTEELVKVAIQQGPERFLADATLYLEFFGIVTIAWQWLLQGVAIEKALSDKRSRSDRNFYQGKMFTLRFFFEYELPKTLALEKRLLNPDGLSIDMDPLFFND
ncbi:MAG: acyl-CoA dehydrogenase C-terminal domain-containing protein, partial [Desulforhopalus sp.]|nr:acyl-CoA dehydrogenase C-terminal domain-containing protein [Desulforhopalus sp.]